MGHHAIQLIEIGLRDRLRASTVSIAERNGDDATLLVIHHGCMVAQIFHGVDAIALLVNVLQVEAVNDVVTDGAAMQKIDKQGTRSSSAQQSGEIAKSSQSAQ